MNATTRDFPDWLGPMLVKELRQGLKARAFVLTFVALQALLVLTVVWATLDYARAPAKFSPAAFTGFFWGLLGVQLLLVTPMRAMNALAGERKANTLELIFMTSLTSWRIAFGKWASLLFQSALFVLAVLPYALLRYFFGGVNLTEELWILAFMLVLSALMTAVALAISGMPVAVRGVAFILGVFASMSLLPTLIFGLAMRGSSSAFFSISSSGGSGGSWAVGIALILFNAALLCLAALEVAGATIAPAAENHALRQRLLALATWLPVPVLIAFTDDKSIALAQLAFFTTLAGISCWHDFARQPMFLRNQAEPFARRGRLASLVGRVFYPGWPGAFLFFVVAQTIAIGSFLLLLQQGELVNLGSPFGAITGKPSDASEAFILALLSGAALLTPPLLLARRNRARMPLLEQSLVHVGGGIVAGFTALLMEIYKMRLGEQLWLGAFPPAGIWACADAYGLLLENWFWAAIGAFAVTVLLMLLRAIPHWRRLRALEREIRSGAPAPAQPVAASAT